jgi:hypothetical protein
MEGLFGDDLVSAREDFFAGDVLTQHPQRCSVCRASRTQD